MTRQSHLQTANPYRFHPAYRMHFPIEGTVVAVHFPQDPTNKSKTQIEYDVEPGVAARGIGRIKNAPLAFGLHGIDADQEYLLKPAAMVIPSGSMDLNTHGPCTDTDGDRVVVQFLNGSASNPVITGILSHAQRGRQDDTLPPRYAHKLELLTPGPVGGAGYTFGSGSAGSTAADLAPVVGDRMVHQAINGTHLALDRNGDLFIDFKAHPDDSKSLPAGAVAKKLVIQNEGQDLFVLEKASDGSMKLHLGQAFTQLLVQVGDGSASVALAEPLMSLYNNLVTQLGSYTSHTHATGMGPSGPALIPVNPPAWDTTIASQKVKVPSA